VVPGDEYQLVIPDSIDDGMCCSYGDASAAFYATADDSDVLISSSNGVTVMSLLKRIRNVSRIVSRIRSFSIADSARAAIVLSLFYLSLK
jgi:hypothetical protein